MKGLFHQKPLFLGSSAVKKILCSIQRKVGPVCQNIQIVKFQILFFFVTIVVLNLTRIFKLKIIKSCLFVTIVLLNLKRNRNICASQFSLTRAANLSESFQKQLQIQFLLKNGKSSPKFAVNLLDSYVLYLS